jgi:hypothetical protein
MEERYYVVKVAYPVIDEKTEKKKTKTEQKLVSGICQTDVEAKVTKAYEGFSQDWRITACVESKIDEVID